MYTRKNLTVHHTLTVSEQLENYCYSKENSCYSMENSAFKYVVMDNNLELVLGLIICAHISIAARWEKTNTPSLMHCLELCSTLEANILWKARINGHCL